MQAKRPKTARRAVIKNAETFFEKMLDILGNGWYYNTRSAPVAQLDRVSDYESEGREFESLPAHQDHLLNGKWSFLFIFLICKTMCIIISIILFSSDKSLHCVLLCF